MQTTRQPPFWLTHITGHSLTHDLHRHESLNLIYRPWNILYIWSEAERWLIWVVAVGSAFPPPTNKRSVSFIFQWNVRPQLLKNFPHCDWEIFHLVGNSGRDEEVFSNSYFLLLFSWQHLEIILPQGLSVLNFKHNWEMILNSPGSDLIFLLTYKAMEWESGRQRWKENGHKFSLWKVTLIPLKFQNKSDMLKMYRCFFNHWVLDKLL